MPPTSPVEITRKTAPTLVRSVYETFLRGPPGRPPEPWLAAWNDGRSPSNTALERLADEWAWLQPGFLSRLILFAYDHAEMGTPAGPEDAVVLGAADIAALALWRVKNPLPGESWAASRARRNGA